jgi:transcriptional regulator
MEFRQLEAFVATAELKSFSQAAKYLYLSQSTISSHVQNLEDDLGKKLLLRTTKSITLTPEGESFLAYARKIVETKDQAILSLQQSSKSLLHLGASSIPSAYLLPEIIAKFREKNPNIHFSIWQGGSEEIAELLLNGSVDIAFTGKDVHSPLCESVKLCPDHLMLVTPATEEYKKLQASNPKISDMLKYPMILRSNGSGTQFIANKLLEGLGIKKRDLNVITQTNDLEAIKQMIVHGVGISICSKFSIQNLLDSNKIIAYPLENAHMRYFSLHYMTAKKTQPEIKFFLEFVNNVIK